MTASKVTRTTKVTAGERTTSSASAPPVGSLHLVAMGDGLMLQLRVPESGELLVGRGRKADANLDAPSISRRHATLRIEPGGALTIEDLGSANGTRVRGKPIAAGVQVPIRVGEVVDLGSVLVAVQRHVPADRPRRIWSHAFFEAHLEEACSRAHHAGEHAAFAVVDVLGLTDEAALGRALRPVDIAGAYAPGEYEVILVDVGPTEAAAQVQRIVAEVGRGAKVRYACCPRDGRSPDTLLAAARGLGSDLPRQALGGGDAMRDLRRLVERIAPGTISVLILGETGVGKEVLAEAVHRASKRADHPFLKLNCAALSESLLESELFGHEKGAFTGAVATKPGLLETADGGTVFLDEIGELPMSTQVKLLRVIEDRAVLRVGGLKTKPIDVRFVAATNRDLEGEITKGTFRQDLYFRLNGITLVIPPLRERKDEIAGLAKVFLAATWGSLQRGREPAPQLSAEAFELLEGYGWPGNIRELRNVIERAALLCTDGVITPSQLPIERMRPPPRTAAPVKSEPAVRPERGAPQNIKQEIEMLEKQRILDALQQCAGNQTHAAKLLGISRAKLVNRLDAYGITRPRKPRT